MMWVMEPRNYLDEMGMDNTDFDTLDDMFGGNPVEEFDDILDGVFDEC